MFGGRELALGGSLLVLAGCGDVAVAAPPSERIEEPVATVETATNEAVSYTPHVVLAVPESSAYVRPDVVIKLLFSMPMNTEITAAAFSVVDEGGEAVAGALHWDVTQMVSAFRPNDALGVGGYQARVNSGACNVDGVELDAPFASDFQVYESSGHDKPYAG